MQARPPEGSTVKESAGLARYYCKEKFRAIFEFWPDEPYKVVITSKDKSNFRFKAAKTLPYKGNRKPKPELYHEVRNYIIKAWGAIEIFGMEADDAIGIACYHGFVNNLRIIGCDNDKDTDMVPGHHFNTDNYAWYYVTPELAMRNFYRQMLTGDLGCDNIPGLKYWMPKRTMGPKTVEQLISVCRTKEDYEKMLKEQYIKLTEDKECKLYQERYDEVKELLYILRTPEERKEKELKYGK